MPPHFALASSLVGAAMNDLTHEDLMLQYANPREYQDKWIYPDEMLQYINDDPVGFMRDAESTLDHFFPACSDFETLAFDCLPKSVNQGIGFLFFSHRKQVVRLMQRHHKMTVDDAIKLKSRGGVAIQALKDFAIKDDTAYSFKRIAQFSKSWINHVNETRKARGRSTKTPGKVVFDFIKKLILDKETHKQLVVVFHGNNEVNFAHAACFVRTHNYFKNKQMLLLDCKN